MDGGFEMMRSPTSCAEPRCGKASQPGSRFCKDHAHDNSFMAARNFARRNDDVGKRYGRKEWLVFRAWLIGNRPICQRINKGVRCTNPSKVGHHIWSPRVR